MIDIDRFKGINDGYGHLAGDVALKEIAQRIESKIRSMDTAARFGGDELAVLLPESSAAEAAKLGERIRECIAAEPVALTDGNPAHAHRVGGGRGRCARTPRGGFEGGRRSAHRRCGCGAVPGQGDGTKSGAGGHGLIGQVSMGGDMRQRTMRWIVALLCGCALVRRPRAGAG